MGDEVVVVPYDPAWAAAFQVERERVAATLGKLALGIEHIGSTSVPGLSAKPVIDLLVGTRTFDDADRCLPLLLADGWEFPVDVNDKIKDRRFLRRVQGGVRTHHLHIVVFGGELWDGYVRFRDALRKRPDLAAEYETLKRDLAVKYRDQRERYTASKSDFVARVLGRKPG
jgi:GrpB-like predicted nucleotidyltransferase (UPF0157 family)